MAHIKCHESDSHFLVQAVLTSGGEKLLHVSVHALGYVLKLEYALWRLVLCLCHVGAGDQTQVVCSGGEHP